MNSFLLIISTFTPSLLFILISIYLLKSSKHKKVIISSFLWGAIGAVTISFFINWIFLLALSYAGLNDIHLIKNMILSPMVEEFSKTIFIILIWNRLKVLSCKYSLFIPFSIGLGFSITENILYSFLFDFSSVSWTLPIIYRGIVLVVIHISTVIFFYLMYNRYYSSDKSNFSAYINSFLGAVVIHSLWNLLSEFEILTFNFWIISLLICILLLITLKLVFNCFSQIEVEK
ncbi:MAG: PrsW family intramembrane metalloprotease [Melioribacteraceae bacterium]|nr:PrsW family intramembrane metalloprotease [Melioribacteraceae bacterium]MCF8352821.1 PrsW family intramembrane metalloprotease [Melioribacteraceae bacterium]MCF8393459.1 PrsW family intramembrane metalloprotease [Melioribacteraceae bacterium]MCF8417338.1 PrsW family intramembrane metalloprotease [Melioribacteraceae bacterium]